MGEVTIDSIQIEIESNSTNATKGLDALAGSLEKLKKNGSFKAVSTNLNNLSTALRNLPNVHSAANSLRTLANSIEKLKGVGSVASPRLFPWQWQDRDLYRPSRANAPCPLCRIFQKYAQGSPWVYLYRCL